MSDWLLCRWATTFVRTQTWAKQHRLSPESQRPGPTGAFWRCASAALTQRGSGWIKHANLPPKNDRIYYLLGLLESDRGNSAKAIADLRQAIQLNPANLRAIYQLASEVERQGDENSDADFQRLMEQILRAQPE